MSRTAPEATARHRLNPGKLLLSKWTAVQPHNREKHFLVSELFCDEQGHVLQLELLSILSLRSQRRTGACWKMPHTGTWAGSS